MQSVKLEGRGRLLDAKLLHKEISHVLRSSFVASMTVIGGKLIHPGRADATEESVENCWPNMESASGILAACTSHEKCL